MASVITNIGKSTVDYFKSIPSALMNATADMLNNSDFISRSIGMANSYEDIMLVVQALGREPVSLLGKDYVFIFDHVRRNYNMGVNVVNYNYMCPKFTFYKEKPTVRFANPYDDPMNLLERWTPDMSFNSTSSFKGGGGELISYAESDDDYTNNKEIGSLNSVEDEQGGNNGILFGSIRSFANTLSTCDLLKKTNDNFNHGKYRTLIARFHTNSMDSKDAENITQTAITNRYGMSHGRNLLKVSETVENGYDNPYCRVWTYHHQYAKLARAIRPFGNVDSAEKLEDEERKSSTYTVGFRTVENEDYKFDGGSKRLDKYGVLNYKNGLVNIAPTAKISDYFANKADEKVTIKKCMFSIENLAWKSDNVIHNEFDPLGLSPEQKGPLGGRIMWFPPYDLQFSEDVRVNWNGNQFIGRGEKVYTYTDTERTGNLSFTLLIDHPSILDYWTGHKKNGMKNQGMGLDPGNTGGVDNIKNQENTLLRFFAGCEVLTAQPQTYKKRARVANKPQEKPSVKDNPPAADESKGKGAKFIHCVLYYPNNYSGVDDSPQGSGVVNAVEYLMNGVGSQKYVEKSKCLACGHEWYPTDDELKATLVGVKRGGSPKPLVCPNPNCRSNNTRKNLDAVDIATQVDNIPKVTNDSTQIGGYELRSQVGVSIVKENLNPDFENVIKKTYADPITNEKKGQFLTTNNGVKLEVSYGGGNYTLAKMIGSKAMSMNDANIKSNLTGRDHLWYRKRWYYRVDKAYENDDLSRPISYLDAHSYHLNGSGYVKLEQSETISKDFGLNEVDGDVTLISFADMFVALEGDKVRGVIGEDNITKDDKGESAYVNLVRDIMNNKDKYKVTDIRFQGHASFQGRTTTNDTLSRNRALTFKGWMKKKGFPNVENAKIEIKKQSPKNNVDKGDNDEITVKMWRSASVIIKYEEIGSENATFAEDIKLQEVEKEGDVVDVLNRVDSTPIEKKGSSYSPLETTRMVMNSVDWSNFNNKGSSNPPSPSAVYPVSALTVGNNDIWTHASQKSLNEKISEFGRQLKGLPKEQIPDANGWYSNAYYMAQDSGATSAIESGTVERYDNEGEFFELLGKNDPFLHNLITDKIKYFDPAFHSVSPEGFNARLTFLHQCTRQGSTVGGSDHQVNTTAYNLAFGRPPVCVLRIGDFYYTRIIINSVSIQYETPQWDLNPEGIGVMPMFAKVSMNFVFLGGSDLSGPISRLQNAVSFNYYANTSVYDNRAEMVEYDPDGSGKEIKFKPFSYPDMLYRGEVPPRKLSGVVRAEPLSVDEFNGRTNNLNQGVSGEIYKYDIVQ